MKTGRVAAETVLVRRWRVAVVVVAGRWPCVDTAPPLEGGDSEVAAQVGGVRRVVEVVGAAAGGAEVDVSTVREEADGERWGGSGLVR